MFCHRNEAAEIGTKIRYADKTLNFRKLMLIVRKLLINRQF